MSCRYLFYFLLLSSSFVFKYVSCDRDLPSSLVTTMNKLNQVLGKNNTKWNSSTSPCSSWSGVSCTRNNTSITKLSLSSLSISNENVDTSWSSLVCDIPTLEALDISNNRLKFIPQPFLLASCGDGGLKALNVSNNGLTGSLPTFQGRLEVLDLSRNSFDNVVIDSQFEGLNELKSLNISNCRFRGSVPTKLGNSTRLQELQLSINSFDGRIPDQVTKYSNLTLLDLSANRLSGTIPSGIGELIKLQFLLLSVNTLTGEIPQSVSTIATLERFAANQNGFTGGIPEGITVYLKNLDLSYNKLNGSVPSDLLSQQNLLAVDFSFNNLQGSIPSNISASLVRLRLGGNMLTGGIPSWSFGNVFPSLTYLEVNNNRISGTIPQELGLFMNLALLDLSYNNLAGFVPRELGELNRLQVLHLQNNKLYGEIPNEISRLQILVRLNMSGNSINGSIPSSLSMLQKLTNLDLQANKLSGEIPSSFRSMDSLLELQLGNNQLGGTIRSLPTKLQIALNLSHNNFGGPMPNVISELTSLEVLDLSNNRFSGAFPIFLRQMGMLNEINVSNNTLTGSVPQFRQNVNVFIAGNANLSFSTPDPSSIPARKSSKTVSVAIIVACTAAVVALVIAVSVVFIVSTREVIKGHLLTLNVIHRTNLDFTTALKAVRHTSNVTVKTRFSTYYKAIMPSAGMSYIVKKLDWSDKFFQLGTHDLFKTELEILGRLTNSSVMVPLAYTLTKRSAYLFYEFTEKGSLFDVLHGSIRSGLDWSNRYSIAVGVAYGLAFLHGSSSGPITLLDLSSKVVMLKSLNEPQIGDIELSKVIDPSKSTGNLSVVAGSIGYVPPEYAYTMRVTMAGNVYSFGVILLELLTGKTAISEGSELAKWVASKADQNDNLDQILDSTMSRTSPATKDQMLAVLKVALACVSESPEARPDMRSVLCMLRDVRN